VVVEATRGGPAAQLYLRLFTLSGGVSGLFLARTINLCLGSRFGHYVEFAIRPLFIIMLVVTSLVVVMLSALFPARRAASINAIEAMRQH
jgi:ABC-type lipoprotein release transport system permease subunit